ncbi:MAG TPA: cell division protein ZapA [Bacteroidetes bacterium]|nr:cell division protein ZapA [Bacteroidota bacterium]
MEDKLSIRVNLADRYYPLKIDRKDEERIRRAAKLINEKILQYKKRYIDKDIQDFMAMAALQFVTRVLELEEKQEENEMIDRIREISRDLETYLEKSN